MARFIDSIYSQESTEMAAQVVQRIVLSAIVNSTDELIKKHNADNILTQYLSEDTDLLTCDEGDVARLISVFKSLGVSFVDIENQICVGELFDAVYRENLIRDYRGEMYPALVNAYIDTYLDPETEDVYLSRGVESVNEIHRLFAVHAASVVVVRVRVGEPAVFRGAPQAVKGVGGGICVLRGDRQSPSAGGGDHERRAVWLVTTG